MHRIDTNGFHSRKVDYQSSIAYRRACNTMAATADRNRQVVLSGKAHASDDVSGTGAAGNQRGPAVNHGIENLARAVVFRYQQD